MGSVNINGKTIISDIISQYPEAAEVLYGIGMHCLGCPASGGESLEDACAVHGVGTQRVIMSINEKISETRK